MKHTLYIFLIALIALSCTGNTQSVQTKKEVAEPLLIQNYLDNFLSENPNCIDNDILREECGEKLKVGVINGLMGDSIRFITQIPVEYEMSLRQGDDSYIIKFVCGKNVTNLRVSDKYDVSFQLFSIVDKETAKTIKDKGRYYVSGTCNAYADNKTFPLPSGKKYSNYPRITKSSSIGGDKPNFDLGTFVVKNITLNSAGQEAR